MKKKIFMDKKANCPVCGSEDIDRGAYYDELKEHCVQCGLLLDYWPAKTNSPKDVMEKLELKPQKHKPAINKAGSFTQ